MKKDYNQRNNIIRWGMYICLFLVTMISIFISSIDFEILRNKNIIKDWHLRIILFLLALIIILHLNRYFIKYMAQHLNSLYLTRFDFKPELQTYAESRWRFFSNLKKHDHVVLLLHGFTGATQEFQFLIPHLEKHGIPYLAPNIIGFGSSNTLILNTVNRKDWYNLCLAYFDYLTMVADKVSIIGHSMGGVLATYIAERRKVHHLILSGPGIYCAKSDIRYRKMLMNRFMSLLYIRLIPYMPKPIRPGRITCSDTLDENYAKNIFQYLVIPVRSLRELFLAQEEVNPYQVKCNYLSILYGKHDLTVDVERLFSILDEHNIKYQKYCFENSAHNVLEDFEREESCALITQILLEVSN